MARCTPWLPESLAIQVWVDRLGFDWRGLWRNVARAEKAMQQIAGRAIEMAGEPPGRARSWEKSSANRS